MSAFPCTRHPHGRTLPADPPCGICNGPREIRTCSCCGATCEVPACPYEHRRTPAWPDGGPTTIDREWTGPIGARVQDGPLTCDDCEMSECWRDRAERPPRGASRGCPPGQSAMERRLDRATYNEMVGIAPVQPECVDGYSTAVRGWIEQGELF